MKLATLALVLPSLLSPPAEAVRKQASKFSPNAPASVQPYTHNVALAPGMESRLHALPWEMPESTKVTSGPAVDEQAQDWVADAFEDEYQDWVADAFEGDDTEASEFPMSFGFKDLDGTRAVSHLGLEDQGDAAHGRVEWTTDGGERLFSWRVQPFPQNGFTRSTAIKKGERKRTTESRIWSSPRAKRWSQTRDADSFRGDDTEASEFPMEFGFDELDGATVSHLGMKDQGEAAHGKIDWTDEDSEGSPLFKWRVHGI